MAKKYRYDHRKEQGRKKRAAIIVGMTLCLVGVVGWLIFRDISKNTIGEVSGASNTVPQFQDYQATLVVDEPQFRMDLPADWVEVDRRSNTQENSISWQAGKKNADNRFLKIYIDKIPRDRAVNKLLPLVAEGNEIVRGKLSENCSTFTGGGTLNAAEAVKSQPTAAKWQEVDFICNLPRFLDNEIGTSSKAGMNSIKIKGPSGDTHDYLFVYTDRNVQPDYSIFYQALDSFRAK